MFSFRTGLNNFSPFKLLVCCSSHDLKNQPFNDQTGFDYLKTKLVRYSVPSVYKIVMRPLCLVESHIHTLGGGGREMTAMRQLCLVESHIRRRPLQCGRALCLRHSHSVTSPAVVLCYRKRIHMSLLPVFHWKRDLLRLICITMLLRPA